MNVRSKSSVLAVAVAALFASSASASISCNTVYGLYLSVGAAATAGSTGQVCAKTATDFISLTDTAGLRSISSAYTTTSQFTAEGLFNAVKIGLSSGLNSPALTFMVPALSVNQTFAGATRDASKSMLEDFLKKNDIIGQIMKLQAQTSATSPISGQGGLIPTMIAGDYNQNVTDQATNIASPAKMAAQASSGGKTPNLIGLGAEYTSLTLKDVKASSFTVPLSYTIRNDIDPRRQLSFSLPITVMDVDGAKSYHAGLGVAYRHPMNDNWTLTPSAKYAMVGSVDLATVAAAYSAGLTSTYIIPRESFDITIGNMLGLVKTAKFSAGDYSFNPNISNTVMRNGVMFSQPTNMGGRKMSIEYSLIDTRYLSGDKPYADSSQEIGITLGTNKSAFDARSFLRAGLTYINAKDSRGYKLSFGYWF
jgi:hypothetical protein